MYLVDTLSRLTHTYIHYIIQVELFTIFAIYDTRYFIAGIPLLSGTK